MKDPFDFVPIVAAAAIGAFIFWWLVGTDKDPDAVVNGAAIGAGVQVGVRLLGVS